MIETRGRRAKYDFSGLLENGKTEFEFAFSKSARVCLLNFCKKKGIKVGTRKIGDALIVYKLDS
jgi:hypothetical protein